MMSKTRFILLLLVSLLSWVFVFEQRPENCVVRVANVVLSLFLAVKSGGAVFDIADADLSLLKEMSDTLAHNLAWRQWELEDGDWAGCEAEWLEVRVEALDSTVNVWHLIRREAKRSGGRKEFAAIIYAHWGGYATDQADTPVALSLCSSVHGSAAHHVFSVDYTRSTDGGRHPRVFIEMQAVLGYVQQRTDVLPDLVHLMGDSAGGGVAAALALSSSLSPSSSSRLSTVTLRFAWTTMRNISMETQKKYSNLLVTDAALRNFRAHYAPLQETHSDPRLSPLDSLQVARLRGAEVHAMIRPRGGGFVYTKHELDVMVNDIVLFGERGVDGVVFGCLSMDGGVDCDALKRLMEAVNDKNIQCTFHRAIDYVNNVDDTLKVLMNAGVNRVLSSGLASDAIRGADTLIKMLRLTRLHSSRIEKEDESRGKLIIAAGCGIRASNVGVLIEKCVLAGERLTHVHASCRCECGLLDGDKELNSHVWRDAILRGDSHRRFHTTVMRANENDVRALFETIESIVNKAKN